MGVSMAQRLAFCASFILAFRCFLVLFGVFVSFSSLSVALPEDLTLLWPAP